MRITWLISSAVMMQDGEWSSPLASVRYRVLSPARYLRDHGNQVEFLTIDPSGDDSSVTSALHADLLVVSKVFDTRGVQLAHRAKQLGARVIVDICDDHFDTPELSRSYFALCESADSIVASTAAMAETIVRRTGRSASVVDDPFEAPAADPVFNPQRDITRLLWFGHPVNFDTVVDMLPGLIELSQRRPLSLHVVSEARSSQLSETLTAASCASRGGLTTSFTPWSAQATWQALRVCDLVLLPSLATAKKVVKSPNRAVESIRSGRFVIAYPLPSYCELGEYLCLNESMAAGIEWAIDHASEVRRRLTIGQTQIERRFHPATIGRAWHAVIEGCVDKELRNRNAEWGVESAERGVGSAEPQSNKI